MTHSLTHETSAASASPAAPRGAVRRWAWPLMQAGLTVVLLGWLFSDPAIRASMRQTLTQANFIWLAAGVGLGTVWISAAVCRWQIFLRIQGVRISIRRAAAIYLIGIFFTLFMPGLVGGEVVRLVYICRERPKQKTAAALSVMMDHMGGLVAMLTTTAVIVAFRHEWLAQSPLGSGGTFAVLACLSAVMLGLLTLLLMSKRRLDRGVPHFIPGREKLTALLEALVLFICQWRWSLLGIVFSFVTLYGYFAVFYCSSRAFDTPASWLDIFSVMPLIDVATALPISISGLGVREALLTQMLEALADVPADMAVLIGLGGFGCWAAWGLVGGVVFACYRPSPEAGPLGLRDLLARRREVAMEPLASAEAAAELAEKS